ncbi:MAG TPA: hypothetical protein VGN60_05195 [Devosia sp.]|jgi:hypothetical protein|nr:hypothetical protein [Devosia sp.]
MTSALEFRNIDAEAPTVGETPGSYVQLVRYYSIKRAREHGTTTYIEHGRDIYHTRRVGPGQTIEQHYTLDDANELMTPFMLALLHLGE